MRQALAVFGVTVVLTAGFAAAQGTKPAAGVSLSDLSWMEAEQILTPDPLSSFRWGRRSSNRVRT